MLVLQGELKIEQRANKQKMLWLWNGSSDMKVWAMTVLSITHVTLIDVFQGHQGKPSHCDLHKKQFN